MADAKTYVAHAKYLRISPDKARRVAREVSRLSYPEAMAMLDNLPQKGARFLSKVVKSAASNALYLNKKLEEDMLIIEKLLVNEGPRMKRMWPRSRGRADVLLKRMSHITVVIKEKS